MKLATYVHDGSESFGVVIDDELIDIPACWPNGPGSVLSALAGGAEMMAKIAELASCVTERLPLAQVRILAPIPSPPKVIGLAGNYVAHIRESEPAKGMAKLSLDPHCDTTPRPFLMPPTAVASTGEEIPWPGCSREIDYEIELAIVIGSVAKCVSPAQAPQHIAGYTIANDISARSMTFKDTRPPRPWDEFFDWMHGKWCDGFFATGPYLVTADEITDPDDLDLQLSVNGDVRQQANSSQMIFDVYEIVSFISHIMTLTPGDVIAAGTPSGVGMASGNFLAPGDVITCRIDGIGELSNTLGPRPADFYSPPWANKET